MIGRADAGVSIEPLGESALLIRLGDGLDITTNARVHAAANALHAAGLPGVIDIVPAYATLAIHFDPLAWVDTNGGPPLRHVASAHTRDPRLGHRRCRPTKADSSTSRFCYGGAHGPDLESLAEHARSMSTKSSRAMRVRSTASRCSGFAPGFPYLLGLDPALAMPRRASPRTRVDAGSVAIGGRADRHLSRGAAGRLAAHRPHTARAVRRASRSAEPRDARRSRVLRAVAADEFDELADA